MSEKAGTVAVTVKRTGNLNQYAVVLCRTEQGSATSSSSVGTRPGQQDYVEYAGQVTHTSTQDLMSDFSDTCTDNSFIHLTQTHRSSLTSARTPRCAPSSSAMTKCLRELKVFTWS